MAEPSPLASALRATARAAARRPCSRAGSASRTAAAPAGSIFAASTSATAGGLPDPDRRRDRRHRRAACSTPRSSRRGGFTSSGFRSPPALTIGGLRVAKAWLLAQEYTHRAREGRIARMIRRVADHPDHRRRLPPSRLMIGLGVWQLQRAKWKEGAARAICGRRRSCRRSPFRRVPLRDDAAAAVPPCDRRLPARRRPARDRPARIAPASRAMRHIVDCATGAEGPGHERRGRLVEEPEREGQLARRPGQRHHRARPAERACGWSRRARRRARAERAADRRRARSPNNHRSYALQWFALRRRSR